MNSSSKLLTTSISSILAIGLLAGAPSTAQALIWNDAGPTNVWSFGIPANNNWLPGNVDWVQGGAADFTGAGETVTIGTNLTIGSLNFIGAGPYTLDNNTGSTIDFTGTGITATGSPGQVITSVGAINFKNSSSAGNSQITVTNAGDLTFQDTSSAGTASLAINSGTVSFQGASSAGSAFIDNQGILEFSGSASSTAATVTNGGFFDISLNTSGTVTLGSLTNSSGGSSGGVVLGDTQLILSGGLTLGAFPGNLLDFELNTPGTSGTILITGGAFTGAGTGEVNIGLSDLVSPGTITQGTYVLIDWTGFAAPGVDLADFVLGPLPAGLTPASYLDIQGSTLVLIAVPEPATFAMPLVAALGMLWLRRRNARVAV